MTEQDGPKTALVDLSSVWLTRDEVAARIRVQKSTVEFWAVTGKGPRFAKFGRHVRYRLSDVVDWENEQLTGGAA